MDELHFLAAIAVLVVFTTSSAVAEDVDAIRAAANKGDATAMYQLGFFYTRGVDVPKDYGKAVEWFRKSADAGNDDAMYILGVCYSHANLGVPHDDAEAANWYRRAADAGNVVAMTSIGSSYDLGLGVPKSSVLAYMWHSLAAAKGDKDAAVQRDRIAAKMTAQELAEGKRLATEYSGKNYIKEK